MDAVADLRVLSRNACLRCRTKKLRCIQTDAPGICERCHRVDLICEEAPARRQRAKKAPQPALTNNQDLAHRLQQLEKNLNHVTDELATIHQPSNSQQSEIEHSIGMRLSPAQRPHWPVSSTGLNATKEAAPHQGFLHSDILTMAYSEVLLEEFRLMAVKFPFVIIQDDITVQTLNSSSPMLLLSIVVVSSWRDRNIQRVLEAKYLKCLGTQAIEEGKESLDILQSLIVYLTWCHFHLKSAYRLNALAASVVVGLRIDKPLQRSHERIRLRVDMQSTTSSTTSEPKYWSAEARRAYIGCYVISSSYSMLRRRTNHLPYSDLLEEYAISLAVENLVPSDALLIHHVKLMKHAETVCATFGYTDAAQIWEGRDKHLKFYVKTLDAKLDEIWSAIPISIISDINFHHHYLIIKAYIYEAVLHTVNIAPLTILQAGMLLNGVEHVQQMLELVSNLTDHQIQNLSGYSWGRIYYVIKLAVELTVGIDSASWDISSVRQMLKLEIYVNQFCDKINDVSKNISGDNRDRNWFRVICAQFQNECSQYLTQLSYKGVSVSQPRLERPDLGTEYKMQGPTSSKDANFSTFESNGGCLDFNTIDFMPDMWFWLQSDMDL